MQSIINKVHYSVILSFPCARDYEILTLSVNDYMSFGKYEREAIN